MFTFCERLKKEREKRGLTQEEMAKAIGVGQTAYCYFENGMRVPSIAVLIQIADYCNVSIDYLVGRVVRNAAE